MRSPISTRDPTWTTFSARATKRRASTRSDALPSPCPADEAQEVLAADAGDVGVAVAARPEQRGNLLEIGDRVDVGRSLLRPVGAVEVRPDADVPGVARHLADV